MNKFLKTILIIFSLVLLSIFLSVVAIYYFIASNPLDFSSLQQFVLTNQYAQLYLFWVAAALAILTVIGIFVIIFYPKRVTKFSLKENRGELALDKRAIEGYVRTSIKQEDFMNNPKVNVAATKNRIKVNVHGQLKKTSGLIGQADQWAKNVETKLRELLGSEEKVSIKVKLQAIEPTSSEATVTRPRVE
ncbi:alkaline shock response membrane anchor protein AmaP [Enterococcus avium]|uniref:alkaline shock response membrane anchor protein AmaP n=1 Tax=Enterococcus avium TaxID=33945 RepID=UPI00232E9AAE|nr:alkaline shock response membrane anchor protein AmaP [Enterococcus avium]MDB1750097.1 alkaline shock response membrane anchor protein AmaP [Enterococcus avium]MDB1754207.1 alkaline shock response membrane anchor protein AmaP [Enterococcus avium]MDB1761219.1 alkaline shock response membrane anchor protein AmaP [Enterococcus avium]